MEKYTPRIYYAVCEYNDWIVYTVTKKRIDEMPLIDVLNAYLTWEGIIGYTSDILSIFGYDKEGNKCI